MRARDPLDRADRAADAVGLDNVDAAVPHDHRCRGRRRVAPRPAAGGDPLRVRLSAAVDLRQDQLAVEAPRVPARVCDHRKPGAIKCQPRPADAEVGAERAGERRLQPGIALAAEDSQAPVAGADDHRDRSGGPGLERGEPGALRNARDPLLPPAVAARPLGEHELLSADEADERLTGRSHCDHAVGDSRDQLPGGAPRHRNRNRGDNEEPPHFASLASLVPRVERPARIGSGVVFERRSEMELCASIDEARQRWDVLKHPFYERWERGELTGEELAFYAGEYRHAVVAVAQAAGTAGDVEHAREEAEHVALWEDFAAAVEAPLDREPTPETAACAEAWS